jgi:hypothetical protein
VVDSKRRSRPLRFPSMACCLYQSQSRLLASLREPPPWLQPFSSWPRCQKHNLSNITCNICGETGWEWSGAFKDSDGHWQCVRRASAKTDLLLSWEGITALKPDMSTVSWYEPSSMASWDAVKNET